MKIAFFSCFDATRVKHQSVWENILAHKPDVLILLGDNIYMDFFQTLYFPIIYSNSKFLHTMYSGYKSIWENTDFRNLIKSTAAILTTWDDHDFAWNNCCGQGTGIRGVPRDKKLISRYLHLQFRNTLLNAATSATYPSEPSLEQALATDDKGIFYSQILTTEHGTPIKVIMTDSRYYRENPGDKSSLLGSAQKTWLKNEFSSSEPLKILCSGSPLTEGKEAWNKYSDLSWIVSQNLTQFLVLTGDIHENMTKIHTNQNGSQFYEFISSGAASPPIFFKKFEGKWGLIEIDDQSNGAENKKLNLSVHLFQDHNSTSNTKIIFPQ